MASVVVPPTLLGSNHIGDVATPPIGDSTTMEARVESPLSFWWRSEPRLDLWVSVGALALGVACLFALFFV